MNRHIILYKLILVIPRNTHNTLDIDCNRTQVVFIKKLFTNTFRIGFPIPARRLKIESCEKHEELLDLLAKNEKEMGNMIRMQFQTSIVVKLLYKVSVFYSCNNWLDWSWFWIFLHKLYFFIPIRMNWISSCCPTPWAGCRVRGMQKRVNHCNFLCVDYRCTQQ